MRTRGHPPGGGTGAVAPADFPPPVDPEREFVKRDLDDDAELVDVGVAIVGGGTAGLACANRLLQLLAEDQEARARLGEVPVAVIEKARTCGAQSLLGGRHAPRRADRAVPSPDPRRLAPRGLRLRGRRARGSLRAPGRPQPLADPGAGAVQEPWQRGRLGVGTGALPAARSRSGWRLRSYRDGGRAS